MWKIPQETQPSKSMADNIFLAILVTLNFVLYVYMLIYNVTVSFHVQCSFQFVISNYLCFAKFVS